MHVEIISTLGGGVGRSTNRLIKGLLTKEDVDIDLFLIDNRSNYPLNENGRIITRYRSHSKSHLISKIRALMELSIRSYPDDIIHCQYASNASVLRRYKGTIVLTMRGFPRPEIEDSIPDKLAYYFEHFCISILPKNVEAVTISEYCKREIKERYNIKTRVIYNGVDCDFFSPSLDRDSTRRELGLQDKKVVFYAGRFHPIKDPLTLVDACIEVSRKVPNLCLIMSGDGPMKDKILSTAQNNNLQILLTGNIKDNLLRKYYQSADLFVLPSIGEAFGNSLAEAMACGCPCITNTTGAGPEILDDKDLLVQPRNSKDLADRMSWILQDDEHSRKIALRMRSRVEEMFSTKRETESYYLLYKSLMK